MQSVPPEATPMFQTENANLAQQLAKLVLDQTQINAIVVQVFTILLLLQLLVQFRVM